jgi:predicted amidohydrolase
LDKVSRPSAPDSRNLPPWSGSRSPAATAPASSGQPWTEGSAIIDPDGWIAASAGPGTAIAVTDIDLTLTHDKTLTERVHLLADRRVDLY